MHYTSYTTTYRSYVLSIWVLFISPISVNGAQLLNITPIFLLSTNLFAPVVFAGFPVIVIVPLASMDESPQSHKFDFNIEVSNLI